MLRHTAARPPPSAAASLPSGPVGSGLILLVIVGAWLAVLVPMALRSHDTSSSLSSVDRFNDAMRVLSRREQTGRGSVRSVVLPARPVETAETAEPAGIPLAVRRRRVLLTLLGLTALTLLLGLIGPGWALLLSALFAVLVALYVVHLRRQAIRKQERLQRAPMARPARRPAVAGPAWIAGIPDR